MRTRKNVKKMKKKYNKTIKKGPYNKEDFESGDGMLTTVWGPSIWHFLHTMSFNYPVKPTREQKRQYKDFMMSLGKVLPCRHCRENYPKNYIHINSFKNFYMRSIIQNVISFIVASIYVLLAHYLLEFSFDF